MLEHLVFSLNRVLPFFVLIAVGFVLCRTEFLPRAFFTGANRFMYWVALPCNLFLSTFRIDWDTSFDLGFLIYLLISTWAVFGLCWLLCEWRGKDKALVGTMVQGAFRGNYAILALPLLQTLLSDAMMPMASLATVVLIPSYGLLAVFILMLRGTKSEGLTPRKLAHSLVRNPLVLASLLGVALGLMRLPLPSILVSSCNYLGQTSTTLGLLSIGGIFDWKLAEERLKPALLCSVLKVILTPILVVTVSYCIGIRGEALFFLFVTFATPTAISSYATACENGGDPPLAGNIVILTTFASAFILSAGIYLIHMWGWV